MTANRQISTTCVAPKTFRLDALFMFSPVDLPDDPPNDLPIDLSLYCCVRDIALPMGENVASCGSVSYHGIGAWLSRHSAANEVPAKPPCHDP